jgi:hypothetical protein
LVAKRADVSVMLIPAESLADSWFVSAVTSALKESTLPELSVELVLTPETKGLSVMDAESAIKIVFSVTWEESDTDRGPLSVPANWLKEEVCSAREITPESLAVAARLEENASEMEMLDESLDVIRFSTAACSDIETEDVSTAPLVTACSLVSTIAIEPVSVDSDEPALAEESDMLRVDVSEPVIETAVACVSAIDTADVSVRVSVTDVDDISAMETAAASEAITVMLWLADSLAVIAPESEPETEIDKDADSEIARLLDSLPLTSVVPVASGKVYVYSNQSVPLCARTPLYLAVSVVPFSTTSTSP